MRRTRSTRRGRKSCRNCKSYGYKCRYCFEFKIDITDVFNANYCSKYKEKRRQVKCVNCMKLNKCNKNRKSIHKKEENMLRVCKDFKSKIPKKTQ